MKLNKNLITRARKQFNRTDETLEELIKKYETACWLSTGPIKSRSEVWEQNAFELESQLKAVIPKNARI